jgi:hypothetical protein
LSYPGGVAVDVAGNIFIADHFHHRIRKVSPDGIITTVAGTGIAGFSGDGGAATSAQFERPIGLAIDHYGNLYVGATYNDRVRSISTAGIVTTIGGNGLSGYEGDGVPATSTRITTPVGLTIDAAGGLLVCDFGNKRIRHITNVVSVPDIHTMEELFEMQLYPNPNTGKFRILVSSQVNENFTVAVTDIIGRMVKEFSGTTNVPIEADIEVPAGIYIVKTIGEHRTISGKICVQR